MASTAANTGSAGGAAMGAFGGFPSMFLPALMSFAPALFGKLFGFDPQRDLRRKVGKLTSAGNVGRVTNQFYNQNLASPAFSQAQGQIAAGANSTAGQLATNLGARGIGTSGSAALLSSAIPSIVGSQQAGLRTAAHTSAQEMAQRQIQAQLAAIMGSQGPSGNQQLFAGGLNAFSPYLTAFLRSRYPGSFGAMQ